MCLGLQEVRRLKLGGTIHLLCPKFGETETRNENKYFKHFKVSIYSHIYFVHVFTVCPLISWKYLVLLFFIIVFTPPYTQICMIIYPRAPRGLGRICETGCVKKKTGCVKKKWVCKIKNWVCNILARYTRNSMVFIFTSFAAPKTHFKHNF